MGQNRKALKLFLRIIKDYATSRHVQESYIYIGEYYAQHNLPLRATQAFKKATELTSYPKYGYAMYKLAWCYFSKGHYFEALEGMKHLVSYAQESHDGMLQNEALNALVYFYRSKGMSAEGKAYFLSIEREDLANNLD